MDRNFPLNLYFCPNIKTRFIIKKVKECQKSLAPIIGITTVVEDENGSSVIPKGRDAKNIPEKMQWSVHSTLKVG